MPDESCRTCGGELANHTVCSGCRKSTQKKCKLCNHVTLLQHHPHCIKKPSPPQEPLLVQVAPRKASGNHIHFSFFAVAVVGFFILGLAAASYNGIPQVMPDDVQATNSSHITNTDSSQIQPGKLYDNCLAYGSGESITVTCPTSDGSAYKAILDMPQDLKKDFSDSVFSIRGVSVTENADSSVVLQYHLKKYDTNYFGN
ncbi:MAG TPA: hypothetical protein VFW99_01945 [Candidatus Nitrosotalea sp.]|nr:hypothetical protein [Candidatus Nitrosotalea sp.]